MDDHSSKQGLFKIRLSEEPAHLDWIQGETSPLVLLQLMDGLTRMPDRGQKQSVVSSLATSWSKSEGDKKWIFKLDKTRTWSDGSKVCSEDFRRGWNTLKDPLLAHPYSFLLRHVGKIETPDCHTLIAHLNKGQADFPQVVSHWATFPSPPSNVRDGSIGTGMYTVKEWIRGQSLLLTPRNNALPELKFIFVDDDSFALRLFHEGKFDFLKDPPAAEVPYLFRTKGLLAEPTSTFFFLAFTFGTPSSLSRDERCALSQLIPRMDLTAVLPGIALPTATVLPHPPTLKNQASKSAALPTKNITHPWTLHYYQKGSHKLLVEWLQATLQKVGIPIQLQMWESKPYWAYLQKTPPPLFLSGTTSPSPSPRFYFEEFLPGNPANWGRYTSPSYIKAVESGDWRGADEILTQKDCAVVPLYFKNTLYLRSSMAQCLQIHPNRWGYFRMADYGKAWAKRSCRD